MSNGLLCFVVCVKTSMCSRDQLVPAAVYSSGKSAAITLDAAHVRGFVCETVVVFPA